MDDVIFAGTQQRKALGLAEVTMVLDNSDNSIPVDFTEIAVTRKLFRSGESDYLINRSSVRLRDVIELFYDTGLGKEAYSVIGQGKIDSILSVKPEERRNILKKLLGLLSIKPVNKLPKESWKIPTVICCGSGISWANWVLS